MRADILNLFRFIDWVMGLPEELEEALWQEIHEYEEAKRMPYVTSVERIGMRKGMAQGERRGLHQGLLAGIRLGLKLKYGLAGTALLPEIYQIEDVALLQAVQDGIEVAGTPDELRQIYRQTN